VRTLAALMRRHSVVSYFCLAYALSWAVWIPMVLAGMRAYQGSAWPNHIPGLAQPGRAGHLGTRGARAVGLQSRGRYGNTHI
jgi:uncharacterized protein